MMTIGSMLFRSYLVVLLLLTSSLCHAQTLQLRNGSISVRHNTTEWLTANNQSAGAYRQVILHAQHILSTNEKLTLLEEGVFIQDYIGAYSYTATFRLPLNVSSALIYGITDVKPEWKIEGYLKKQLSLYKGEVTVIISFVDNVSESVIQNITAEAKGHVLESPLKNLNVYTIQLPANKVMLLASSFAVKSISAKQDGVPLNYESKSASKASIASQPVFYGGHGLLGQGVTIGVGDNVSGNCHIDLKDRITNFNPVAYANHGVHINGIVAGAGIVDSRGQGVAPKSKLINHIYSRIWENTPVYFPTYNMTITNNSYASIIKDCDFAGTYNTYAEAIDKLALKYPNVLHVFAAGNDGLMNCAPYPDGYATVVGGYQPAKNNVVVTSSDKSYVNAADGGRGPVKDGRLKPEITAVGVNVSSTTKVDEYLTSGGTSMASPGVAGGLALLTERYKQLHSNTNPRTDILKTILLNGTTDLGNPGPDYKFGFGFMNVYRSLEILDSNRYVTDSITNGSQKQFTINVPANTAQFKVMLYWHDVASSPMAAKVLVNDLDIEVKEPSNTTHLPLILNPQPERILDNAVEGADHLNNCEQVVINNPTAGVHTVAVKGFNVPTATQLYVVGYDFIPVGVRITYPYTGAQVKAGDSLYVYWDASDNNNTFSLSYSTDGGGNWNVIDNNMLSGDRYYVWKVPATISSGKCMMKLLRNNTSQEFATNLFVINPIPVLSLDATQCPGYIRLNWTSVPGASVYNIMLKVGDEMKVVAATGNNTYTLSGLSLDSMYYVAVQPVIDGMEGYRSIAVKRQPKDGNCLGNISDGDLMLQKILKPTTGRKLTSTELTSTESFSLLIRNLDNVAVTVYNILYNVNGSGWQTLAGTTPLPANSSTTVNAGSINLSATGIYTIAVAVQNQTITDPVGTNDTLMLTIRQLNNPAISLTNTQTDDFEDWAAIETVHDSIGMSPNERWDYFNTSDTSRLRSFVNSNITISGNRSISLDAVYNFKKDNSNELQVTYNLANYSAANDEVRMEFDYRVHGMPKFPDGNMIQIRGKDNVALRKLSPIDFTKGSKRQVLNSGSLSLTDALQAAGETFSTSTQIKITQNDTSLISEPDYGSGLTLDNFKIYTVFNDIQLLEIVSPINIECGLSDEVPLTIKVRNGVNQILNNVKLYYQLDSGAIIQEVLSSIKGKEVINYTFAKSMHIAGKAKHTLSVWLSAAGDTYLKNDSLLDYIFYNQSLVDRFPYSESFEAGNGGWYTEGANNSWQYGKVASPKIKQTYSGTNAWKTNLTGNYNVAELSYLYSPCFDVSALYAPAIRFKKAMDIEDCGNTLCDGADLEYSTDRVNWTKLNLKYSTVNWYNDTLHNVWTKENDTTWQTSYSPLPLGMKWVNLRFRFTSDLGAEKEGLALDDIELFDDIRLLQESNLLTISPNPTRDGKINIEWTAKAGGEMSLAMFNTMGKEVYSATAAGTAGYNKTQIETPHFASGVYIVNMTIGTRRFTAKIVYLW